MSPIENHVDWTVPSTPNTEGVVPGLSPRRKAPEPVRTRRSVVDALLGDGKLTAYDSSGNDPYNATGRQFRR
jgi:hypothetical protein